MDHTRYLVTNTYYCFRFNSNLTFEITNERQWESVIVVTVNNTHTPTHTYKMTLISLRNTVQNFYVFFTLNKRSCRRSVTPRGTSRKQRDSTCDDVYLELHHSSSTTQSGSLLHPPATRLKNPPRLLFRDLPLREIPFSSPTSSLSVWSVSSSGCRWWGPLGRNPRPSIPPSRLQVKVWSEHFVDKVERDYLKIPQTPVVKDSNNSRKENWKKESIPSNFSYSVAEEKGFYVLNPVNSRRKSRRLYWRKELQDDEMIRPFSLWCLVSLQTIGDPTQGTPGSRMYKTPVEIRRTHTVLGSDSNVLGPFYVSPVFFVFSFFSYSLLFCTGLGGPLHQ